MVTSRDVLLSALRTADQMNKVELLTAINKPAQTLVRLLHTRARLLEEADEVVRTLEQIEQEVLF